VRQHHWPGNVRELRNYIEQWLVLRQAAPLEGSADVSAASSPLGDLSRYLAMPLREAKQSLSDLLERAYVTRMLEDTQGNVAEAARRAGVDRVTLFRAIRRYGLRGE
jgi:DNA-binding NtrC family response regulator